MIYGKVNKKRMEKIKKLNLKWYALHHSFGDEKLTPYNILHDEIVYYIDKCIDETGDYEQIKEKVHDLNLLHWERLEKYLEK